MTAQREFWVIDPARYEVTLWSRHCRPWPGDSVEDVAKDAASFWALRCLSDDESDEVTQPVIVASDKNGADAQMFNVTVTRQIKTIATLDDGEPVSVGATR